MDAKDSYLFNKFIECINEALRHTNPQVRKQGEALFKVLYLDFGDELFTKLVNQKPQLVQKLTNESKQEKASKQNADRADNDPANMTSTSFGNRPDSKQGPEVQRTMMQLSDNFASMPQIKQLLDNQTDVLKELRMPNPKKRL